MSSNKKLATFTKVIILFCLIVFIFILLPDSALLLKQGVKFIIFIGIFFIIFLNSKLLNNDESELISKDLNIVEKINISPNKLYNQLNGLISSSIMSINQKAKIAIYILDPDTQLFNLQTTSNKIFLKSIKPPNEIVDLLLEKSRSIHQKDYQKHGIIYLISILIEVVNVFMDPRLIFIILI